MSERSAPRTTAYRGALRRGLRRAGFTFLELMGVITIIALGTALVVANMEGLMTSSQLSHAARTLGNEMQQIQDLASLHGREILFEIDIDGPRWRVVDVPSPTEVPDERDREEQTFYGEWFEAARGIHLDEVAFGRSDTRTSGVVEIAFDGNGEVSPSGFVAYFYHDDLGEEDGISVELTGLTGLVAFHHGRIEPEEVRDEEDF